MSDPTPVGRVIADMRFDVPAAPPEGVCSAHPESHVVGCQGCADDQDRYAAQGVAADACTERFPTRYKYADIEDIETLADVLGWAEEFRTGWAYARSLLLLGGTGSGKTHAAYAALRYAVTAATKSRAHIYRTPRWKALTHADLMASLRPRAAKDADAETILTSYLETDLLFIDDLGAIKATEFVEEMTYRLINGRYEAMRPNIVTSNLPLLELKDAIGDRIASRLAQDSVRVALTTPDRRRQRAA